MTLDDAITAFGQVASDDLDSIELDVRDYERLVKWLTELKLARESAFSDIGLAARAVSENHQLKTENAKLRELVSEQRRLAQMRVNDAVRVYWAGGSTSDQFDALMKATARVNRLSKELGIEADA